MQQHTTVANTMGGIPKYTHAKTKREKSGIVNAIIKTVESEGGHFLSENDNGDRLEQVRGFQSKEKVGHTLRAIVLAATDEAANITSRTMYDVVGQLDERGRKLTKRRASTTPVYLSSLPNLFSGSASVSITDNGNQSKSSITVVKNLNVPKEPQITPAEGASMSRQDTFPPVKKKAKLYDEAFLSDSLLLDYDNNNKKKTTNDDNNKRKLSDQEEEGRSHMVQRTKYIPDLVTSSDIRPGKEWIDTKNEDAQPGAHDVLCDRNPAVFHYVGNKRFHVVCGRFISQYTKAKTKKEKSATVREIIATIHNNGGKFLAAGSTDRNWQEIYCMRRKSEKVGCALRAALRRCKIEAKKDIISNSANPPPRESEVKTMQHLSSNTSLTIVPPRIKCKDVVKDDPTSPVGVISMFDQDKNVDWMHKSNVLHYQQEEIHCIQQIGIGEELSFMTTGGCDGENDIRGGSSTVADNQHYEQIGGLICQLSSAILDGIDKNFARGIFPLSSFTIHEVEEHAIDSRPLSPIPMTIHTFSGIH